MLCFYWVLGVDTNETSCSIYNWSTKNHQTTGTLNSFQDVGLGFSVIFQVRGFWTTKYRSHNSSVSVFDAYGFLHEKLSVIRSCLPLSEWGGGAFEMDFRQQDYRSEISVLFCQTSQHLRPMFYPFLKDSTPSKQQNNNKYFPELQIFLGNNYFFMIRY